MSGDAPFPSRPNERPIADYGLVGDMRGAALVARDAALEWLCLPHFDSVPVFLALLDAGRGGACTVVPRGGTARTRRRYLPGTNILETTLEAADGGTLAVTDFMPVSARPDAGVAGPDNDAPGRLVRVVRCVAGRVGLRVSVAPRFDWARAAPAAPSVSGGRADYGDQDFRVVASRPLSAQGSDLVLDAELGAGEEVVLVLGRGEPLDEAALRAVPEQLDATRRYWTAWSERCTYRGPHADLVVRSALCLKLLTYAPTGGLIASTTASLPEWPGGVRNWDYRYVWTRDASFTVTAFLNVGHAREAAEFLRFLAEADHGDRTLRVVYGVNGPTPREERLEHLAGWRDSRPVLAGNNAENQVQLEIYGELLAALHLYITRHGRDGFCEELRRDLPDAVTRLADTVAANWREPDQGIWEMRGPPRHYVHDKAVCWVALDRAVRLAPELGLRESSARWLAARDAIGREWTERGWNERRRSFTQTYGGEAVDASLLRMPIMEAIDARDPRMTGTLEAVDRDLRVPGTDLYYRYRGVDDGLPGEEGAFAACTYWAVGIRTLRGELDAAREMLEQALARANDLGLFAEMFHPRTGEHLGNFPQAFTHMALIHATVRLFEAMGRARQER